MKYNWYHTKHYGHITGGRVPKNEYKLKLTAEQKEALKQLEDDKINYAIHDHPHYI